ncbi:hypothetical protein QQS21_004209 [Conoideocrella luteorostrata]|uniref:FAD-binding PCMH-type domain-containing protein n=1 Tax=Conoideocrella luteorostrata TaxID=1105319 RepID=A0AAJ0G1S0_9HYPO|nr:hypothetical protein QQS21_004209 [Conoideocrella luteorostrata]
MRGSFIELLSVGSALLSAVASAAHSFSNPHYLRAADVTPVGITVDNVRRELGRSLSRGTLIFGPHDSGFEHATERWAKFSQPEIQVVIEVAQESDVQKIVNYCNRHHFNFLAYGRGHGVTNTVAKFNGIEINMSKLVNITIQPDQKSALFQGGVYGDLVISTLWDKGFVTSTGSNACVGLVGPGLGGGLGRFQGEYGLIADNFISLNVVLSNGETAIVSADSHSDLFWAMKGAGHNFAIVTSVLMKIYPKKSDTWHYHNYVFHQSQLETFFNALNKFQGKGDIPPAMGVNFGQFSIDPSISSTEAVIGWSFAYNGPAAAAEMLLQPFNAIPALSSTKGDVSYPDLLVAQQTDIKSQSCTSARWIQKSVFLQTYNVTTERHIYNAFNKQIVQNPSFAPGAIVYHEGYSTKGTRAIDPASSAYPHRDEYLLVFFLVAAPAGLESESRAWADQTLGLWTAGQPDRTTATYVNYAAGDESLESIYGAEQLPKLRNLKSIYDTRNSFRWYNPIIAP